MGEQRRSFSKKRGRQQKFLQVNDCLWKWYVLCRNSNIPVSGPMLQEEALIIAKQLGEDAADFTASNVWLDRWKKRYNIIQMNAVGEEGDVSEETMTSWDERVRELVRGYQPKDVWNMDETGLLRSGELFQRKVSPKKESDVEAEKKQSKD